MAFIQFRNSSDEYDFFEIKPGKDVVFGRGENVEFLIDNDSLISRQHFSIKCKGDKECYIVDMGAKNGTFYNGKRLELETLPLSNGDKIRAGKQTFIYYENKPTNQDRSESVIQITPFSDDTFDTQEVAIAKINEVRDKFMSEMGKVIVGQEDVLTQIMVAFLARGHCLLIGVPGLAKTLMVRVLAGILDLDTNRVQFTPDLMPADITGTDILEQDADNNRKFRFKFGPIFTNILLADEINRTPPKTQAALLEAMQEQRVTASGVSYNLPEPFLVLATQNPIEQEGTYPLPEAQLDRFMFCINLDYPTQEEEEKIILETTKDFSWKVEKILDAETIIKLQHMVRQVPISEHIAKYAASIVRATRPGREGSLEFINKCLRWGAGPRAGQYLVFSAKAHALLEGRFNVSCEDIKKYAYSVLRHRIFCNFSAASEGITPDDVIRNILESIKEPQY